MTNSCILISTATDSLRIATDSLRIATDSLWIAPIDISLANERTNHLEMEKEDGIGMLTRRQAPSLATCRHLSPRINYHAVDSQIVHRSHALNYQEDLTSLLAIIFP